MKEGKFKNAAQVYKNAADLSMQMREEERAKELQAMAKEINPLHKNTRKQDLIQKTAQAKEKLLP